MSSSIKSPKTVAERNAIITAALAKAKGKKPAAPAKVAKKAAPAKKAKAPKAPKAAKPTPAEKLEAQTATGTIPLSTMVTADIILRKSTLKSPCQVVWETASEMKGAARKDVLSACMSKGIAYYTARTQYQQWKAAGDNDKKTAAKSA